MSKDRNLLTQLAEPFLEKVIFNNRLVLLIIFGVLTALLGYQASKTRPDASLERMIPLDHPYVINLMDHRSDLENLANFIRISVAVKEGDIFNADYMEDLKKVSDEVFYLKGIDRSGLKSLWTPNVRWVEVTEEGFQGGTVIPGGYDGSAESLKNLRQNILRSGQVGRLVANDFKSSIVYVPLFEKDPETGEPLDYHKFSLTLEEKIRDKFATEESNITIHIIGFAKKIGDLIEGLGSVVTFFLIAVGITTVLLYLYARCAISTFVSVTCSVIAVVWQMGLMQLLGFGLDPYSVLIPFIVFATAISHGVQFINGITHEVGAGKSPQIAAIRTFRSHYLPAMLALISDAIGFLTLIFINIDVIQGLAVGASVGIASIIITNLILLPILMSYFGVTRHGIRHVQRVESHPGSIWNVMSLITHRKVAPVVILIAQIGVGAGLYLATDLKIGELDAGAPELHPDSRYNKDNAFITSNYSTSADVMVVMVTTGSEQCNSYEVMDAIERLQWVLEHTDGVQSTGSLVNVSKTVTKAFNEGSYKWMELSRNQKIIDTSIQQAPSGLLNPDCSLTPVLIFLNDHRADTLQGVVTKLEAFAKVYNSDKVKFLLAAGNAGIEVATNQVIEESQNIMLLFVYLVVAIMIFVAYRSVRAVCCIVVPLCVTSVLCMALMAELGIGVKVSTLPVIALGVGLGVDYGIYIYSRLDEYLREGMLLQEAYLLTLRSTGKAVGFTGLTLAIGTATWIFSPIKLQSDMGILLTFMFLWNMVGALTLLPALAHYFLRPDKQPSDNKQTVETEVQSVAAE